MCMQHTFHTFLLDIATLDSIYVLEVKPRIKPYFCTTCTHTGADPACSLAHTVDNTKTRWTSSEVKTRILDQRGDNCAITCRPRFKTSLDARCCVRHSTRGVYLKRWCLGAAWSATRLYICVRCRPPEQCVFTCITPPNLVKLAKVLLGGWLKWVSSSVDLAQTIIHAHCHLFGGAVGFMDG